MEDGRFPICGQAFSIFDEFKIENNVIIIVKNKTKHVFTICRSDSVKVALLHPSSMA